MKEQAFILVMTLVGCALDEDVELREAESAFSKPPDCSDPANCTVSNNGGVYTTEHGYAGFGSMTGDFMLTHFIKNENSVTFEGRFQDTDGYWTVGTGRVSGAYYTAPNQARAYYDVIAVDESYTVPTFTLRLGTQQPITVVGNAIVNNLILDLYIGSLNTTTVLPPQIQVGWSEWHSEWGHDSWIRSALMVWRRIRPTVTAWSGYCFTDEQHKDYDHRDEVVFQQGLGIHAASGDALVTGDSDYVTLSCKTGGIAKAREWGYQYRTTAQHLGAFKAAIHAKRASFCGDKSYYTVGGTAINVYDKIVVRLDMASITDFSQVEALWNAEGAICVNPTKARHFDIPYPNPGGQPFTGECHYVTEPDKTLPTCSAGLAANAILATQVP